MRTTELKQAAGELQLSVYTDAYNHNSKTLIVKHDDGSHIGFVRWGGEPPENPGWEADPYGASYPRTLAKLIELANEIIRSRIIR